MKNKKNQNSTVSVNNNLVIRLIATNAVELTFSDGIVFKVASLPRETPAY